MNSGATKSAKPEMDTIVTQVPRLCGYWHSAGGEGNESVAMMKFLICRLRRWGDVWTTLFCSVRKSKLLLMVE